MTRKQTDLKIKSINELIVPEQLQGYVHLIEWLINKELDDSSISELFKLIENYSIEPDTIVSLLYEITHAFPHKYSLISAIGEIMRKQKIIKIYHIFNVFRIKWNSKTIFQLIFWDKLDEFVAEIEKEAFDINYELFFSEKWTLINTACKYGSENCFTFLKLKGATISAQTSIFAVEGGNKNIIMSLYNDHHFEITDEHFTAALKYHHNDIFDWLLETKGSCGELNVAECFSIQNIKGLVFLIENGFNINCVNAFRKLFIIMIFYSSITSVYYYYNIFIFIIRNSSIIFVYHYCNIFINHICLSFI